MPNYMEQSLWETKSHSADQKITKVYYRLHKNLALVSSLYHMNPVSTSFIYLF
jgi:hypothetical protein